MKRWLDLGEDISSSFNQPKEFKLEYKKEALQTNKNENPIEKWAKFISRLFGEDKCFVETQIKIARAFHAHQIGRNE